VHTTQAQFYNAELLFEENRTVFLQQGQKFNKIQIKRANDSSLGILKSDATLCHTIFFVYKIKFIAFIYHVTCSSYRYFNDMLKIIKMLCNHGDLNSRFLLTMVN
jgi:hypothetical protein